MMKAFVDTTIIADILLNSKQAKANAKQSLKAFESTSLPVYAIKEFKAGPLSNFVYFHNKLVQCKSFELALAALQKLSRTPQRYKTSTSIQALHQAVESSISRETTSSLKAKYGATALMDNVLYAEMRLAILNIIEKAWKFRRKITTDVVMPLPCYRETSPNKKRELIELDRDCSEGDCWVCKEMQKHPELLTRMRDAIKNSPKQENQKRSKVLREMARKPKNVISKNECRHLGDAVFAFFCPEDSVILTTNTQDFLPLAKALGKKVVSPNEILKNQ